MAEQLELPLSEPEEKPAHLPQSAVAGSRILYFDLETQKSADEVGGWGNIHKMGLSVGVVWDSLDNKFHTFLEKDTHGLIQKLLTANLVVGFNVKGFDYTVLQPYIRKDLDIDLERKIPTFDMLEDIRNRLNFRLSLDHLAQYTLNARKSADGLMALDWYKKAKKLEDQGDLKGSQAIIGKIVEYCKKDVEITRDLFKHGVSEGFVKYRTKSGKIQNLEVNWKDKMPESV